MIELKIKKEKIEKITDWLKSTFTLKLIAALAIILSFVAIEYCLIKGIILSYGDAQSHINIAKRVVDSITPGFAQLGGVWLPLPHILMLPFVKFEVLYRSGLAGSIVSGIAFVISSIYVYKTTFFLTKSKLASFVSFIVFATNPNMLYLQATPMTESTLICFFILSTFYFIRFVKMALSKKEDTKEYLYLILAAFFAFSASLSRYDGWFLVIIEAVIVILVYLPWGKYIGEWKKVHTKIEGNLILFSTLAFMGIFAWVAWDGLILGNPLYFTNSEYSAKSQQQAFLARGQLPAYHNLPLSFLYFFYDVMANVGVIIFVMALIGLVIYLSKRKLFRYLVVLVLLAPFIFNVLTLFLGQSIIFIPHLTPPDFEWRIFNVRYGILMLPAASLFFGLLFKKANPSVKLLASFLILIQFSLYIIGYSPIISYRDGVSGLSASKISDADHWMKTNYDGGLILMDDFARSLNIIADNLPVQKIVYVGNRPYWQESLKEPEKYLTWIAMQKDDAVWKAIYEKPEVLARMYKYFVKVYTSPDILIFKRNDVKI